MPAAGAVSRAGPGELAERDVRHPTDAFRPLEESRTFLRLNIGRLRRPGVPRGAAAWVVVLCVCTVTAMAAELRPATLQQYIAYDKKVAERFERAVAGEAFLDAFGRPGVRPRLLRGEIVVWTPSPRGAIVDIDHGLVHNWEAAAFIPRVTLDTVVKVSQDYPEYARIYEPIVRSELLDHQGNRFDAYFRFEERTSWRTAVLDTWSSTEYSFPRPDRTYCIAHTDRIQQIEGAGTAEERRLPEGQGDGYLWRGATYTKFLERDGGVYVELETVGLSRSIPAFIAWLVKPIARRIGRSSAADSLEQMRTAVSKGIGPSAGGPSQKMTRGAGTRPESASWTCAQRP